MLLSCFIVPLLFKIFLDHFSMYSNEILFFHIDSYSYTFYSKAKSPQKSSRTRSVNIRNLFSEKNNYDQKITNANLEHNKYLGKDLIL